MAKSVRQRVIDVCLDIAEHAQTMDARVVSAKLVAVQAIMVATGKLKTRADAIPPAYSGDETTDALIRGLNKQILGGRRKSSKTKIDSVITNVLTDTQFDNPDEKIGLVSTAVSAAFQDAVQDE